MKKLILIGILLVSFLTGCSDDTAHVTEINNDLTNLETKYQIQPSSTDNINYSTGVASYAITNDYNSLVKNSDAYISGNIISIGESFYNGAYIETKYSVKVIESNDESLSPGDVIDIAVMGGVMHQKEFLNQNVETTKLTTQLKSKKEKSLLEGTIEQSGEGAVLLQEGSTYEFPLNKEGDYYQVLLNGEGINEL